MSAAMGSREGRGMEKSSCRVNMIFGVAAAILVAQGGKAQTVSETVTYFHTDRLGSTVMVSDASGNIQSAVDYRPYGQPVQNDPGSAPGYTGQYNDPATGLTYMRARYYDSNVGVFLSTDPVGSNAGDIGSFGRFVYANDNPLRFVDPTGMKATTLCYNCSLGPSITNLPGITAVGVSYPDGAGFVSLWTNHRVWIRYGAERGDWGRNGENKNEEKKTKCAAMVPEAPQGADIDRNIEAASHMSAFDFYAHVENKGPWDYKQLGRKYESFGNFNYGATGLATGLFGEQVLLRMAGWAQTRAGTSKGNYGHPWGSAPYGDDPNDQAMIKKGFSYYYSCGSAS